MSTGFLVFAAAFASRNYILSNKLICEVFYSSTNKTKTSKALETVKKIIEKQDFYP
jgi:hypothetical protein